LLHQAEIIELATREVVELRPLVLTGDTGSRMWDMNLILLGLIVAFTRDVDELQDQRPPGDDAAASG
jgi:hypothetical protein